MMEVGGVADIVAEENPKLNAFQGYGRGGDEAGAFTASSAALLSLRPLAALPPINLCWLIFTF